MGKVALHTLVRAVALVVAAVATLTVCATATVRGTLLDPGFHDGVLDEQHAYDRLYNEVLVDPESAPVTRALLARLEVPEAQITSNIKLVLPPDTLRDLTRQQIHAVVGYLNGDRQDLRLVVDLRPVLANLGDLAHTYFGDLVAGVQHRSEPDFGRFRQALTDGVRDLAHGRAPEGLPKLPLTAEQASRIAGTLLTLVPAGQRATLRPEVETALADGDLGTALAAVAPVTVSADTRGAAAQLRQLVDGGTWDLTDTLKASGNDLSGLREVRPYTAVGLGVLEVVAAGLLLLALTALWLLGPRQPGRRLVLLGAPLVVGGALAALAAWVTRIVTDGRLVDPPASWPPSLTRLVDDVQGAAVSHVTGTALWAALVPVLAGSLLAGVGLLARSGLAGRVPRVVRQRFGSSRRAVGLGFGAAGVAVAGMVLMPLAASPAAARECQGSTELCDRPYDEVAYLTAHNAMSTTADHFIGPLQDPRITAQLDHGVRALQLDTYRWETPEQFTERLDDSDFTAEQQALVTSAVNRFSPPREGLWLCHSVCRAGAIALVPTLREIKEWMDDHPNDVLTLIIQDGISGEDTQKAFRQAGLDDLVRRPDAEPAKPWPTLGEMIDSGRRLMVFAEKADGPAPWYRNFYRYGMETPFTFRSPDQMSCVPHRGGDDKRLFLMNHFITNNGGSRIDAGTVNARRFVLDRAERCERERGRPVNFVAVDYATIGDARGAVDALNARR
ncbi:MULTISPECIES: PI-PLC domain-containing protein [unclassified Streptomyces]|uniref:PI-PLC domain-containing protein n=1 Tax=unclassified Streptomyces TaxID=2593676 RepID=UPI00278C4C25|nr:MULTISPECIES: PI-PLC domain-containing protein [unclassified Streptomyces]